MKMLSRWWSVLFIFMAWGLSSQTALAAAGFDAIQISPDGKGGETYSVTLQVLMIMTSITFLPSILILMTSFTRIVIVLALLRQAIGTQSSPNTQIIVGLALFLTFFIMSPVIDKIYDNAFVPYNEDKINFIEAVNTAKEPLKDFMLTQTREDDLKLFVEISGNDELESVEDIPMTLLIPAFAISELKTAFQIGFLIFIPFLIIDLIVASVLMSMGMMMLSHLIVSLPFKLMLFVLIDGWAVVIGTLAASFVTA